MEVLGPLRNTRSLLGRASACARSRDSLLPPKNHLPLVCLNLTLDFQSAATRILSCQSVRNSERLTERVRFHILVVCPLLPSTVPTAYSSTRLSACTSTRSLWKETIRLQRSGSIPLFWHIAGDSGGRKYRTFLHCVTERAVDPKELE